jgi:hypothetical protein
MQVLVELAQDRDEDIPALIYEGRSTVRIIVFVQTRSKHAFLQPAEDLFAVGLLQT